MITLEIIYRKAVTKMNQAAASASYPVNINEGVRRMKEISDSLDSQDGVAYFSRVYLQFTKLMEENLVAGFFEDSVFVERLVVIFARLYFQDVDAVKAGQQPDPSWKPLFDARSNRIVWPVQFALAGMNAHINHDLILAVIAACQEFGKTPDAAPVHADYLRVNELLAKIESEVRQSFETKLIHIATKDAETLKHIVTSWTLARSRDVAWHNAEMLWQQYGTPFYDNSVRGLAQTVSTAGRLLVTPVVPPPPD
jgi:hypothetical protein